MTAVATDCGGGAALVVGAANVEGVEPVAAGQWCGCEDCSASGGKGCGAQEPVVVSRNSGIKAHISGRGFCTCFWDYSRGQLEARPVCRVIYVRGQRGSGGGLVDRYGSGLVADCVVGVCCA